MPRADFIPRDSADTFFFSGRLNSRMSLSAYAPSQFGRRFAANFSMEKTLSSSWQSIRSRMKQMSRVIFQFSNGASPLTRISPAVRLSERGERREQALLAGAVATQQP